MVAKATGALDDALRVMVFDRTCRGRRMLPGLSHAWSVGGQFYRAMGRLDRHHGVTSWEEALTWLANLEPGRPLAEVQYWGHGKWGNARVAADTLDSTALCRQHRLYPLLRTVANRMLPGARGLWWFRTCETFGAQPGQSFAREFSDFLGCRAAGHTYIIGHWQSGLHSIHPGQTPGWPDDEGLRHGTPANPKMALWSRSRAPNTITALHGRIPSGF